MPFLPRLLAWLTARPHRIFAVDSSGALLTALLTAGLARGWPLDVGLPAGVLHALAACAGAMALYGAACALFRPLRWRRWLAVLAGTNAAYCLLTAAVLATHQPTALGYAWVGAEWLIISALVWVEVRLVRLPQAP